MRETWVQFLGGEDGIPVELFQILKDDAVKVLHSIYQQIWKNQQWLQDWKRSVFIPIPKKGNAKECSNYRMTAFISHTSKVMLRILQAMLQKYVNRELPDVQAGFRKGTGTRDQIANIHWIMGKAREFQKNIYFCFIDYAKAFDRGMTEDEMAGWHRWLDGREFEWTPGVGDGQGGLVCCNSWGCKESDMTEQLNWTELNWSTYLRLLMFLSAILIPACASSSPEFCMMYSAYKLNKQGDNVQSWSTPFPFWNQSIVLCPVLSVAFWPAYRFLRRQVR